jgi:hypothetical protein
MDINRPTHVCYEHEWVPHHTTCHVSTSKPVSLVSVALRLVLAIHVGQRVVRNRHPSSPVSKCTYKGRSNPLPPEGNVRSSPTDADLS